MANRICEVVHKDYKQALEIPLSLTIKVKQHPCISTLSAIVKAEPMFIKYHVALQASNIDPQTCMRCYTKNDHSSENYEVILYSIHLNKE